MDCQTFTVKHGLVRCKHWDKCHRLGYCLCEVEPQEDGTLPLPRQPRTTKKPWPKRRQQLIEFARQHETIDTTMIMEHTNAAHGTTCTWLKRLTHEGELKRLTRAILAGENSQLATFAIVHHSKED